MKYLIRAVDRKTGHPVHPIILEAANEHEARTKANDRGLLVVAIESFSEAPTGQSARRTVRVIRSPTQASTAPAPIQTECPFCRERMNLDAAVCPHCGRSGGFSHQYVVGWIWAGALLGMIINIVAVAKHLKGEEIASSPFAFPCMLICGPYFWFVALPLAFVGAIVGSIHAAIAKSRVRNRARP